MNQQNYPDFVFVPKSFPFDPVAFLWPCVALCRFLSFPDATEPETETETKAKPVGLPDGNGNETGSTANGRTEQERRNEPARTESIQHERPQAGRNRKPQGRHETKPERGKGGNPKEGGGKGGRGKGLPSFLSFASFPFLFSVLFPHTCAKKKKYFRPFQSLQALFHQIRKN